jgi:hypothetical protein
MNRMTLRFWAVLILACAVFAAIPWRDVHPATLVGYTDANLALDSRGPVIGATP